MITTLNVASVMVLDQDEALDFYVNKLGLEKGRDIQQGTFRWLTVRVPGDSTEIFLEEPGPPVQDDATAAQIRDLVTKGALGGLVRARRHEDWRLPAPKDLPAEAFRAVRERIEQGVVELLAGL